MYKQFFRYSHLIFLFLSVLLYIMGAGIARYLGATLDWDIYWLGQGWVLSLHLGTVFLDRYYREEGVRGFLGLDQPPVKEETPAPKISPPLMSLLLAAVFLTVTASISVNLYQAGVFSQEKTMVFSIGVLGSLLYSLPPARLSSSPYKELVIAILMANAIPTLAFTLQSGQIHRLLVMITFPLTLVLLAVLVAFGLSTYGTDLKKRRRTLLYRMGWQNGMTLHTTLILVAFLLFAFAAVVGLPVFVYLPALVPLPLALFEVWYMSRIANGAKPNWNVLTFSAAALFGLLVYLISFAFWTH